ncbi:MAG: hypothetical protein JW850_24235 [Thermoflexales bacterium]|nr:hypothetical protein [Thermoflexales bacterium]
MKVQDTECAIQVHFGSLALQFGIGNVPNLFMRFYRHLVHTPQQGKPLRLSDAEAMLLVHVMALRSDQDFVLRLSNLPMTTPVRTREDYLGKLRKMGLVFTSRIYYTRDEMIAYYGPGNLPDSPRMKAQQWDLSSLIYNLSSVAEVYLAQQRQAVAAWQQAGETGPRPVTELPVDYQHETALPVEVLANIANGAYYPIPSEWKQFLSVPAEKRLVRIQSSVPAENEPVQTPVPAGNQPVQTPYQPENGRSSMLTTNVVNTSFGSEPASGSLASVGANTRNEDHASQLAFSVFGTPDDGQERNAHTTGVSGNGSQQRDKPAARVPQAADGCSASRRDAPAAGPDWLKKEPLQAWRERVLRDLRDHANDKRIQVYIVAVNVGQLMGLRWDRGELRTWPDKSDKAEIGKMCRELGGPAKVWQTACRIAGHEYAGDPLDYLWGTLRTQNGNGRGGPTGSGDFEQLDYSNYRVSDEECTK